MVSGLKNEKYSGGLLRSDQRKINDDIARESVDPSYTLRWRNLARTSLSLSTVRNLHKFSHMNSFHDIIYAKWLLYPVQILFQLVYRSTSLTEWDYIRLLFNFLAPFSGSPRVSKPLWRRSRAVLHTRLPKKHCNFYWHSMLAWFCYMSSLSTRGWDFLYANIAERALLKRYYSLHWKDVGLAFK